MTMELAEKLCRKEIEARRNFAEKSEALCDVVRKFDGKIFNKRLETALREILPVKIDQEFLWKSITMSVWIEDRMVRSDNAGSNGYREVAYIKNDQIYVGIIRDAFDDNKRIIAENIIRKIRECAEYERKSADSIEEQLGKIGEIILERDRIESARRKFLNNTNSRIREYFELEV